MCNFQTLYLEYFVHSYTIDIVFTLSYWVFPVKYPQVSVTGLQSAVVQVMAWCHKARLPGYFMINITATNNVVTQEVIGQQQAWYRYDLHSMCRAPYGKLLCFLPFKLQCFFYKSAQIKTVTPVSAMRVMAVLHPVTMSDKYDCSS